MTETTGSKKGGAPITLAARSQLGGEVARG